MSTQVATQTQHRGSGQRGRRGNRGRGGNRGGRGGGGGKASANPPKDNDTVQQDVDADEQEASPGPAVAAQTALEEPPADEAVCWICAEPVKYYALSECNHRTCHVCALRLRALYKKTDCTFCKEPQNAVLFTLSPDAPWSSYTPESMSYKDAKLNIFFETQEIMEESLVLLRFNCPESTCDYIANGWSDLKLHTRATHGKVMCDLCIRFKKIFAHEHALYFPNQLPLHVPSLQRGRRQADPKVKIEGGVHPLCAFCNECSFGDDELYKHMREKHEECFICKRNEVRDQYFRNYDHLEQHFKEAHYACTNSSCLAQKFVVFETSLDLKGHMVSEHGAEMSARDRKDARRVQADFEFEEVGVNGRRGRRDRGDREREREPPPQAGPSRGGAAGARRREAFGGTLTTEAGSATPNAAASRVASRRQSPSPDLDPATAERQTAFLARVSSVAPNPNGAIPAVKAAVRSYRANESGARDLISTIWNISDRNLEGTAGVINALVDFIDEDDKKKDLLQAWNGFKIERRNEFPELVPTGQGTEWAGITGGRLLNAKQSTSSRSASQSTGQVLDRVARAAASSSSTSRPVPPGSRGPAPTAVDRFPPLQASAAAPARNQPNRTTPWASGSSAPAPAPVPVPVNVIRGPTSVPGPGANSSKKATPPIMSKSAFPELPSSSNSRVPKGAVRGNQSLKKILGNSGPSTPVWERPNGQGSPTPEAVGEPGHEADGANGNGGGGGKGKKGKGKQKQTLFTLGSFPA